MCNYPFSKLTKVAEIILSLTQTPSAIERIFSLQGRIHGRDRNRLNNDTTNKLLMVTHMTNMMRQAEDSNELDPLQFFDTRDYDVLLENE